MKNITLYIGPLKVIILLSMDNKTKPKEIEQQIETALLIHTSSGVQTDDLVRVLIKS